MILNTSLTLCMEIVFPGGGGSGRSPFESADPARRGGRSLRESCFLCSSSGIGGEGLEG